MASGRHIPEPPPGHLDAEGITESFARRYSLAKDGYTATDFDVYQSVALAVRDRLMERWFLTQDAYYQADAKRVYYLSLEFLMGRALLNNIISLGALPSYQEALSDMGFDLAGLCEKEWDAGLGNGGLGRLAACFLDSAATLSLPLYGYGIRYEYGIFRQHIRGGYQVEAPDNWLRYANAWEIARPDVLFPVRFYGRTAHDKDADGRLRVRWVDTRTVWAMAYDSPIAGYQTSTVNTLRLWSAKASREFDLERFNAGEYVRAVEEKNESENLSKVLYPRDDLYVGKELRLKQQFFFVSATLQDLIRRFRKHTHHPWETLPEKAAVQLNDTHPVLAIPELMRLLVDEAGLEWEPAWDVTQRVFSYTNHMVLPEALEKWPVDLVRDLLPRHFEIIEEIDRRYRLALLDHYAGDEVRVRRMGIVDGDGGQVRMAHLGFVGSHAVNGVAELHTEIIRSTLFSELNDFFPNRVNNRTNGVTPRRWLLACNPALSELVTEVLGEGWARQLEDLAELASHAADASFRERWTAIKQENKLRLAARCGELIPDVRIDADSLFDVQIKRIHEYKRQLLNVLHVVLLYHRIRDGHDELPRTVFFGGKAAPGYEMAKLIIKLIHSVADLVAGDPLVRERLRVVFVPNYSVSLAELMMPACELSEQISTAGTEASGTGNMKAALNGGLTIGTLDGANVEIQQEVGPDNVFIFGHTVSQIAGLRDSGYRPEHFIGADEELRRAIDTIATGELARAHPGVFEPVVAELTGEDRYFVCADFRAYVEAQRRAAAVYRDTEAWQRMSIANVAGMGKFSSDRTVSEYARDTWHVEPVEPPSAVHY